MSKEDIKMSDVLANSIFDAMYDEDDLIELKRKNVIAQELGFKLSTIATISCEIDDSELKKNHEKLKHERDEAVAIKNKLLQELCNIQSMCIGEVAMGYKLDACNIGNSISECTGMSHPQLQFFLSKLKGDE